MQAEDEISRDKEDHAQSECKCKGWCVHMLHRSEQFLFFHYRLRAWGRGEKPTAAEMFGADDVAVSQSQNATSSIVKKPSHCGTCGHPGKVIEHRKGGCRECGTEGGECGRKEKGFQCQCDWCVQVKAGYNCLPVLIG
jgi:hypothetical protein